MYFNSFGKVVLIVAVYVHSVTPLSDGSIVFTDQDSRQVKQLQRCGNVAVMAGTGKEGNKKAREARLFLGNPWAYVRKGAMYLSQIARQCSETVDNNQRDR